MLNEVVNQITTIDPQTMVEFSTAANSCISQMFADKMDVAVTAPIVSMASDMVRVSLQMFIDAGMNMVDATNLVMVDYAPCIPMI